MRRRTRIALLVIIGVVLALLALGALPNYIRAGDPYHLTATPVDDHAAINGSDLDERRYPYTTAAVADVTGNETGRSDPYWRGYVGFKEAFTHSPFDEITALQQRSMDASDGDSVYVRIDGTIYRLAVTQQ